MLLSQKEVASKLGVHRDTIRNWRKHGQFPAPIVNMNDRRYFWSREQIEKWQADLCRSVLKSNPS